MLVILSKEFVRPVQQDGQLVLPIHDDLAVCARSARLLRGGHNAYATDVCG